MLLTMESKTAAAHKLERLIDTGRSKAGEVVEYVMNHQPTDRLIRGAQFGFEADPNLNRVTVSLPDAGGEIRQRLHRHSIQQMAQTTDLPLKFIDSLQQTSELWGRELLAHNLSTVFRNRFSGSRYLIRSVNQEVRGFLSDRYRRLDSRPIIEAFATAVQEKGALPYNGYRRLHSVAVHRLAGVTPITPPPVTFLFPGQGSQTLLMGKELYRSEPVFRRVFDDCLDVLSQYMDRDPRTLTHISAPAEAEESLLLRTDYAQPLLFVFEYALAFLWISWGVKPDLMIGHSLGEYVAACLAGTLSLPDALKLIVLRGQLMQATEPGAMLGVPLGLTEAISFTDGTISLAAVNSASQCVFSGSEIQIESLRLRLENEGIHARRLAVGRAFHSTLMDPILDRFRDCLETISLTPPRIAWLSNLTGSLITKEQAMDPEYWVSHLRSTVRFYDDLQEAHARPDTVFLEIGPQRVLQLLANRLPLSAKNQVALSSINSEKTEYTSLLSTLGALWVRGVSIDWSSVYANKDVERISLPTYPFERQRCWVERPMQAPIDSDEPDIPIEMAEVPDAVRTVPVTLHRRPHLSTPYVPPSTPTQRRLAAILEPVFGITPLGIRDNFFALGADSLTAVAVVSQLNEQYGVQLAAVHLYEALDIFSLAATIDEMVATHPYTPNQS